MTRNVRVAIAIVSLALGLAGATFAAEKSGRQDAKRKYSALETGSIPHDELGRDIKGAKVLISDHHGKVVIVSFWASWCGPCRKELPVLAGIVKQVGPEHIKVIAINYMDAYDPFRQVVKILQDFPITILRDQNGKAARRYEVSAIPRMIVIGRDGKVAADHTGYGEDALTGLVEELNSLLAQR